MRLKKRTLVLLGAVVVAIAASIGAYAYFTNTGSGVDTAAVQVANPSSTLSWTVAFDTTSYNSGSALYPTDPASANAVVASVPWTVTNGTEGAENLTTYTIQIDPAWSAAHGPSSTSSAAAGCAAADFSINGLPAGTADTQTAGSQVAPPSGTDPVLPSTGKDLAPNSDGAPADQIAGTATIEMIDTGFNQDGCKNLTPDLKVTASS